MIIRPYVVEFLGTPEAGKTTTIKRILNSFSKKEYIVQYIRESAEITPKQFQNGSIEAQIWMQFHTAQNICISLKSNADIILIDRGIIDTLFWSYLYFLNGDLSRKQLESIANFFFDLNFIPNLAIILTTTGKEAIARKGREGKIVTEQFVDYFNASLNYFCDFLPVSTYIYDTTNKDSTFVSSHFEHLIESRLHL